MPKPAPKLEAMQRKQDELAAQIADAKKQERARMAQLHKRRCEIVGAAVLKALDAANDRSLEDTLAPLFDRHTIKARDRKMLGLPPMSKKSENDTPSG
ncbi:MAG: hypothetical protein AB8B71_17620 [Paracoccaceae bacterium]